MDKNTIKKWEEKKNGRGQNRIGGNREQNQQVADVRSNRFLHESVYFLLSFGSRHLTTEVRAHLSLIRQAQNEPMNGRLGLSSFRQRTVVLLITHILLATVPLSFISEGLTYSPLHVFEYFVDLIKRTLCNVGRASGRTREHVFHLIWCRGRFSLPFLVEVGV